ncbi:hypothetical protein MRX96_021449 [Rhipicephalus microplus]
MAWIDSVPRVPASQRLVPAQPGAHTDTRDRRGLRFESRLLPAQLSTSLRWTATRSRRLICAESWPAFPCSSRCSWCRTGGSLNNVKSCYVDAVVTTHVLCGVKDLDAVLKEIARVLAPGGKFFYVEHMRHDPGDWRRYVQMLVGPLWRRIFNGCSLTQELHDGIQKSAHFASVSQCKVYSARSKFVGIFLNPVLVGIATKREFVRRRPMKLSNAFLAARAM